MIPGMYMQDAATSEHSEKPRERNGEGEMGRWDSL